MDRIAEQKLVGRERPRRETIASLCPLTSMEWTGYIRMLKDGLT
jgi:hypothetical protein